MAKSQETYDVTGRIDIAGTQVTITGGELTLTSQGGGEIPQPQGKMLVFLGGLQRPDEITKALAATVTAEEKTLTWPGGFSGEIDTVAGLDAWMDRIASVKRKTYLALTNNMGNADAIQAVLDHRHREWIAGCEVEDRTGQGWTKAEFLKLADEAEWPVFAFARMREIVPDFPNRSDMHYPWYASGTSWDTGRKQVPIWPRTDRLRYLQDWRAGGENRRIAIHGQGFGQKWGRGPWESERNALAQSAAGITWSLDQAERAGCHHLSFWGTRQMKDGSIQLTWDRNPQLWHDLVYATWGYLEGKVLDHRPDGNATLIEVVE